MMANDAEADLFVSIHRNAMPVPGTGSGVETLVFENKGVEGMLAKNIGDALGSVGFTNLGTVERPGLVVLRRTNVPSVLVEAGFIDNEEDNYIFDDHFQEIAQAIADGIFKYHTAAGGKRDRVLSDPDGGVPGEVSCRESDQYIEIPGISGFCSL